MQLVGGSVPNEGRLEVYIDGEWGTVNRDGFGMTDANVVCRSLGYGDARNYVTTPVFGRGTGSIHLDDVGCRGTEESIFDCNKNRRHESTDTHDQDVGVGCQNQGLGRFIMCDSPRDVREFRTYTVRVWDLFIASRKRKTLKYSLSLEEGEGKNRAPTFPPSNSSSVKLR